MLADLVLILAAILLVGLVAGWEIFCLTDLARAARVLTPCLRRPVPIRR
jgi:hypothetical protein